MDLRDRFAAEFAAALLNGRSDPDELARHAYDLADAMLRERERRIEEEGGEGGPASARDIARETPFDENIPVDAALYGSRASLLDDPEPLETESDWASDEDLPDWIDAPYDPRWELEARWSNAEAAPGSRRPGLARTMPETADAAEAADANGTPEGVTPSRRAQGSN